MNIPSLAGLSGRVSQIARAQQRVLPVFGFVALLSVASSTLMAQTQAGGADDPNARRRRGGQQDDTAGNRNFDPAEMQARMLTALRERLEVTDDEEWKLISDRITKLSEIRRATAGAGFGGFGGRGPGGGPPGGGTGGGDPGNRGGRTGRTSSNPEMTSLSAAVQEKLPEAEIKARLSRVREVRKESEQKLAKAQEDLRAVLSVRQEAVAVISGLLP